MKQIAVVGATGAVGKEIVNVLERRKFPVGTLKLFASAKTAAKKTMLNFRGQQIPVEELTERSFENCDIALFSAGAELSEKFAPIAVGAGCVVVDNSSVFRSDPTVPLIVPEINAGDIAWHQGIIANPNCTTAISLMALWPLHQAFGLKRIFASSYQAVSGSGQKGIAELQRQISNLHYDRKTDVLVYPHPIAYNLIPHIDSFLEDGYTKEEMKMQCEGRKIMHHPLFWASMTCVRVPVYCAHSVAISAEFSLPITAQAAWEVLLEAPGLDVLDVPEKNIYPMPLLASERDNCQVGRIRKDCALENGISFWICGDQLLKGAALNAVQIAELLLKEPRRL